MSTLASRAECAKLARQLGAELADVPTLAELPADVLRHLRLAVEERCARHERLRLAGLARLARWLPLALVVLLVRWRLSPLLTARLAALMPAERVAALALRLPPVLLAGIAGQLEARAARDLIRLLPLPHLLAIAEVLLARRDFITLGRFVGLVPDAVVSAVAERIPDEADLLAIVFHLDAPERIDHLVHQLPPERIERALLLLSDASRRPAWPALLALVSHVGPGWQRVLGERAAAQGDAVLDAIIQVAHEDGLWEDLLPVVGNLSPALQRHVVNLDSLLSPPVLTGIVAATARLDLWPVMLDVVAGMDERGRDLVAGVMAPLSEAVFAGILHGAMLRSAWPLVCDILRRLPARRADALRLIAGYQDQLDSRTATYVDMQLRRYGLLSDASCVSA